MNDVLEALPPDGLTAALALVIGMDVFVDAPDPVTPTGVVMLDELGDVVIEKLPAPGEDALLLGVDVLELVGARSDDVDPLCVNNIEIPLVPSTDPVWTLTIGLQGCEGVLVGEGA